MTASFRSQMLHQKRYYQDPAFRREREKSQKTQEETRNQASTSYTDERREDATCQVGQPTEVIRAAGLPSIVTSQRKQGRGGSGAAATGGSRTRNLGVKAIFVPVTTVRL
jgi:hypothetical protein